MATAVKPNTGAITTQLNEILNLKPLKQRFQILPKDQSHKTEKQFSTTYVAASVVLAALSFAAYKKVSVYAAAGLGVVALAVIGLKGRVNVDVPTQAYTQQCDDINALFLGVADEFRVTWNVAANLIAGVVNSENHISVENANEATKIHTTTYLNGTWRATNDPFIKATEDEKPWRKSFQALHPLAQQLINIKLEEHKDLHPVVAKQLARVQVEATRLVNGHYPVVPNTAYVENKFVGKEAEAKLVSQPWSPAKV